MVLGKWWFHCSLSTDKQGKCDDFMGKLFNLLSSSFSLVTQLLSPVRLFVTLNSSMPGFPVLHSVQFTLSVMSDSLRPHGLQHARPPCLSPTHRVYSDSCPLSQWCHPTISSSVVPFSSRLQSFPASGSFPMSQFFILGDQSIRVSASAWVLPMNIQDWSPLGWTGWISLQSKGLTLKSLLQHHCSKA